MLFNRKNILMLVLLAGFLSAENSFAQKETRKHKWMWWRFGLKKRDGFNPYVEHNKATHEQSRKQKREDAKILKQQKRAYKKWQRKSRKKAGV